MRNILILALASLTLACASTREDDDDEVGLGDQFGDWSSDLRAVNNSGITGDAGAQSAVAATAVTISIRGARAGAQHPWHIHRGTCSTSGQVIGQASDYPVLTVGTDGTVRAAATIGVPLNENERYHVNVHRSPTEMSVIVACGELRN